MKCDVRMSVNGEEVEARIEPRLTLADFLREALQLTGTHTGCEMGVCGACLVLLDGKPVHACLTLAVQAQDRDVVTIEGLAGQGVIADLQSEFHLRNALQCGYCTPGMLMTAHAILQRNNDPDRETLRKEFSGNFCRCTGYEAIIDAVAATALSRRAG